MGIHYGHGKTVNRGLVFGYDTGDTYNSYKGEPTENLLYTDANVYNLGATTDFPIAPPVKEIVNGTVQAGMSWNDHIRWYSYTIPSGTQITVSGWYMVHSTDPTVTYTNAARLIIYSSAGYGGTVCDPGTWNTWKYFEVTYTVPSDTTSFRLEDAGYDYYNTSNASFTRAYTCNVQVEVKSHATPFVAGTRSTTEGLLDLTGNSTIDLTNASFDSDAQMTFDGSSDYASVGYSTAINTPNGATYEIMLYPQGAGEFLSRGKSDSGTDPDNPRFYLSSNGYLYFDWSIAGADTYVDTPPSTATFNQWNHVVGVAQPGDQLRIYVNGVEASYNTVSRTVPSPIPNTEDPIIIGGVSWIPRYFDGKVAMVKLYNRVLTAGEIKQNFNHYKSRFGI